MKRAEPGSPLATAEAATREGGQPFTCQTLAELEVFELAYRQVTGLPLYYPDDDFDEERITRHLGSGECSLCPRWFSNAKRTCERMVRTGRLPAGAISPAASPAPEPNPKKAPRPLEKIRMAAGTPTEYVYETRAIEQGLGLDGLHLVLRCRKTEVRTVSNPGGWELTLLCPLGPSEEGEPPARREHDDLTVLREHDNCLMTFRLTAGLDQSLVSEARLDLVEGLGLLSSPCPLASLNPADLDALEILSRTKLSAPP